ncbi:MAG: SEC-C metal-binding domain-containing protein, partial [Spirochaetia bacterium]
GWKMFYEKTLSPLEGLALHVLNEQFTQNGRYEKLPVYTPGPEQPCLCGSGKKYKNCHGTAANYNESHSKV